ncbi:hypothetical protein, conserved [Eimeria praecox]|uniref:Uncharacterized protein n=1 Tax=Eimeria praecox TaxID=51316 RepID=U6H4J9_9EIME|nr:hypothetical protein, conserved [Eimeria praecox]
MAQEDAEDTLSGIAYPRRGKASATAGLAAFASVVAVLFLVSYCVVVPSRKETLRPSPSRRLAARDNPKYNDTSRSTFARLCELPVLEGGPEASHSTRPARPSQSSKPNADNERRGNTASCIIQRKRGMDEEEVGQKRRRQGSRELQKLEINLLTLSDYSLGNPEGGILGMEPNQSLDQYIDEALAAGEANLPIDAWLLDPSREMPPTPTSELQPTTEEPRNGVDDHETLLDALTPISFEGTSDADCFREASYDVHPGTHTRDSQVVTGLHYSQLVSKEQQPVHPLDQYIDEALAADEASLSIDAWLLDPSREMPPTPTSSELQPTTEEPRNGVDDHETLLDALTPISFEGGTSGSAAHEPQLWEERTGTSRSSPPCSDADCFREASHDVHPGTHMRDSQSVLGQQYSQRVNKKLQPMQLQARKHMKGQGGEDGLVHQVSNAETPAEKDISTHPFFRLPSVAPGAFVRDFRKANWKAVNSRRFNCLRSMVIVKDCLKMPVLDWNHLDTLITHAELLVGYAVLQMKLEVEHVKPRVAVERLAFALILIDSLYAASEVWGPQAKPLGEWLVLASGQQISLPLWSLASCRRDLQRVIESLKECSDTAAYEVRTYDDYCVRGCHVSFHGLLLASLSQEGGGYG